ncbi:hypothetical protein C6P46_003908, partial [Rhodotorula mucilaginosa]
AAPSWAQFPRALDRCYGALWRETPPVLASVTTLLLTARDPSRRPLVAPFGSISRCLHCSLVNITTSVACLQRPSLNAHRPAQQRPHVHKLLDSFLRVLPETDDVATGASNPATGGARRQCTIMMPAGLRALAKLHPSTFSWSIGGYDLSRGGAGEASGILIAANCSGGDVVDELVTSVPCASTAQLALPTYSRETIKSMKEHAASTSLLLRNVGTLTASSSLNIPDHRSIRLPFLVPA